MLLCPPTAYFPALYHVPSREVVSPHDGLFNLAESRHQSEPPDKLVGMKEV